MFTPTPIDFKKQGPTLFNSQAHFNCNFPNSQKKNQDLNHESGKEYNKLTLTRLGQIKIP